MNSLIRVVNETTQAVEAGGAIDLGHVSRRYGCNLQLYGNAIQAAGRGYYDINTVVTVVPDAVGVVTVALLANGVALPGATVSTYAGTASQPVTIPVPATDRICDECARQYTVVLVAGAGSVTNITTEAVKR